MYTAKNLKLLALSIAVLTLALKTTISEADDFNKTIEKALKFGQDDASYGQIKFDVRVRYDNSDSENPRKIGAEAFTGRLRLGYLTPVYQSFQAYAEYEGNQILGADRFDSGRNGKSQYERIADPQEQELNQLWLSYKGVPSSEIKFGRQIVQFDNERFIGPAAWRQLQRTFDAVLISNQSLPNTTIKVGYLIRMLNTDSTLQDMELPLANIAYKFENIGTLSSYAYLIDERNLIENSNQSYGVRFDGTRRITDQWSLLYTAEYAYQRDYASNPTNYQIDYYHVIGGASAYGVTLKAGMEQLGGKGLNKTFDTPLGLLHRFNGWADLFLVTPNDGLRDIYVTTEANLMGSLKLTATYHDFFDDSGSKHYGDEWDFLVSSVFFKHYTLSAKYAYFNAEKAGSIISKYDTQKLWLYADLSF